MFDGAGTVSLVLGIKEARNHGTKAPSTTHNGQVMSLLKHFGILNCISINPLRLGLELPVYQQRKYILDAQMTIRRQDIIESLIYTVWPNKCTKCDIGLFVSQLSRTMTKHLLRLLKGEPAPSLVYKSEYSEVKGTCRRFICVMSRHATVKIGVHPYTWRRANRFTYSLQRRIP